MTQGLFVGIDAGTTGVTVAVYNESGVEVASGYEEYPCVHPRPGWVEQDLDVVWRGICKATREAVRKCGAPADAYKSVGVSSQRGTFGLLDSNKNPLCNSIVWNDARATEYGSKFAAKMPLDAYQDHTGMPFSPQWTAAKILWIKDNDPDLFKKTRWFANSQEFFLHRLGAEDWSTDPASLTLNGMMDIRRLDWSDKVLEICGIDRTVVPRVGSTAAMVGRLSRDAAELTGLPVGTPLCRGAGDQQCAAIGAGVIKQGMAEFTVGTAAMMVAHVDSVDRVQGKGLFLGGHGVPGQWDLEGGAFASGSCLRWWRDMLGLNEVTTAQVLGISPYSVMVEEALKAPPGANGLIFHPFLAGQVTPYYDMLAKSGFIGLGLHQERPALIRALLEGCANEMRAVVDTFKRDMAGGLSELRVTGGGTKSIGYVHIMADIIGMPLSVPKVRECTALGAAILGAIGAGCFKSAAEAANAMVHIETTIEPNRQLSGLYDEQHGIFLGAYEALAHNGVYKKLQHFAEKRT